jgi:transcription initiation factor TFIID subunit 3
MALILVFLTVLKRKHNKTDQESKYAGTILGRSIDHGEVLVEGGPDTSLAAWAARMREASLRPPELQRKRTADDDNNSRPPSSGLSSLADEEVEMMDFD